MALELEQKESDYYLVMANKKQEGKVGMWQAIRDVLIASMNRGQFPLAVCALIIIVGLFKMPSEDVSKLAFEVLKKLESGSLIGYVLAGATSIGWRIHVKWQRRIIHNEMERLSEQRNQLQGTVLGAEVVSSKSPKAVRSRRPKKT